MGNFDLVIGVVLIGLFFNTYLYGLVTYQFIVYKTTSFNDRPWIKGVVLSLFIVDTIHSIVAMYAAWELCVTNYDKPGTLAYVSWTIPFTAVATSVAAIITQFFLGHRVFILTQSKVIVAVIGVLSVLGFIFGTYAGIYSGILHAIAKFGVLGPYVTCWLVFQTAADLTITFTLSFVLARSRTGFRKTDTIINRIIRGAVQTGLFASVFALADMFSFLFHRNTNLYAMFAFPLGRIYTNTLLDTLNARSALKGTIHNGSTDNAFRMQQSSGHTVHAIQVQKETVADPPESTIMDGKYPVGVV